MSAFPDQEKTAGEIRKGAWECQAIGDLTAAFGLWAIAVELDPSTYNRISLLETARLLGCVRAMPSLTTASASEIIDVLGTSYSYHLLCELAHARPLDGAEVRAITKSFGHVPRAILANVDCALTGPAGSEDLDGLFLEDLDPNETSIWRLVADGTYTEIDAAYLGEVPRLHVLDPTPFSQPDLQFPVRAGAVFSLTDVRAWIGSDLLFHHDEPLVDFYSWPGSDVNDPRNDSKIINIRNGKIRFVANQTPDCVEFNTAIWIAYPQSANWGHWVRDILCRLVYISEHCDFSRTPVIVSSNVPPRFLSLAKILFPHIHFVSLDHGTAVRARKMFISPSRVFATHNPHWSLDGLSYRLNAEPESFRRIKALLGDFRPLHCFDDVESVYLRRSGALNIRSLHQAERLEATAHAAGFTAIDPGELSNEEQLSLFMAQRNFVGIDGSQWFLAGLSSPRSESLILGHDLSTDSRGRSWIIEDAAGQAPHWVIGLRDFPMAGYGEKIYHQPFRLSAEGWESVESWCWQHADR